MTKKKKNLYANNDEKSDLNEKACTETLCFFCCYRKRRWETGVRTLRIRLVWMAGRRCLRLRPKFVFLKFLFNDLFG